VNQAAVSPSAFPLTAKYDPAWIREHALGENTPCQVESLARRRPLRAGMRVLDLGCGKATSSILFAREFGIEVYFGTDERYLDYLRRDGVVLRDAAPLVPLLQCGDCLSSCGRCRARTSLSWTD
jgi:SAM-dependent methyltransferase